MIGLKEDNKNAFNLSHTRRIWLKIKITTIIKERIVSNGYNTMKHLNG